MINVKDLVFSNYWCDKLSSRQDVRDKDLCDKDIHSLFDLLLKETCDGLMRSGLPNFKVELSIDVDTKTGDAKGPEACMFTEIMYDKDGTTKSFFDKIDFCAPEGKDENGVGDYDIMILEAPLQGIKNNCSGCYPLIFDNTIRIKMVTLKEDGMLDNYAITNFFSRLGDEYKKAIKQMFSYYFEPDFVVKNGYAWEY